MMTDPNDQVGGVIDPEVVESDIQRDRKRVAGIVAGRNNEYLEQEGNTLWTRLQIFFVFVLLILLVKEVVQPSHRPSSKRGVNSEQVPQP